METCLSVIQSAYRRSGIVGAAQTSSLSSSRTTVGLERLQGLFNRGYSTGMFGAVSDYYLQSGDYTAEEYQRIYKQNPASVITIPNTLTDVSTGLIRPPRDGAIIIIVDPATSPFTTVTKFYDFEAGWFTMEDLQFTDTCPWSGKNSEHIKNLLAVDLLQELGLPPDGTLTFNAGKARLYIMSRYNEVRRPLKGEYM